MDVASSLAELMSAMMGYAPTLGYAPMNFTMTMLTYVFTCIQDLWALIFVVFITYRIFVVFKNIRLENLNVDSNLTEDRNLKSEACKIENEPNLGIQNGPKYFIDPNSVSRIVCQAFTKSNFNAITHVPVPKNKDKIPEIKESLLELHSLQNLPQNTPKLKLQLPVNCKFESKSPEFKLFEDNTVPDSNLIKKEIDVSPSSLHLPKFKNSETSESISTAENAKLLSISNVPTKSAFPVKKMSKLKVVNRAKSSEKVSLVGAVTFTKAISKPSPTQMSESNFPSLETSKRVKQSKKKNQRQTLVVLSEVSDPYLSSDQSSDSALEPLSPHNLPQKAPNHEQESIPEVKNNPFNFSEETNLPSLNIPKLSPQITPNPSPHLNIFHKLTPTATHLQAPVSSYPQFTSHLPQQNLYPQPFANSYPINYSQMPQFTPNYQYTMNHNFTPAQYNLRQYTPQQIYPNLFQNLNPAYQHFPLQNVSPVNPFQYLPQQGQFISTSPQFVPQSIPNIPQNLHMPQFASNQPQFISNSPHITPHNLPQNPLLPQFVSNTPQSTTNPTIPEIPSQFTSITFYPRNKEEFEANHPDHYVHSKAYQLNPRKLDLLKDMHTFIAPQNQSYYDFPDSDFATRPISQKDSIFGATYERILADFNNTPEFEDKIEVLDIECIENAFVFLMYELKRMELETLYGDNQCIEYHLFHGVTTKAIDVICSNNFRPRKYATKHGKGVPFSKRPYISSKYTEGVVRKMLVSRVVISEVNVGDKNSELPQPDCDTTRNTDFSVFVKYDDHTFYPQYIVSFLCSQDEETLPL